MKGSPQSDPEQLKLLVLEIQALLQVQDARHRALRRLVVEVLQMLKVHHPSGTSLDQLLRNLADEELDAKLAMVSDDDPNHAAQMRRLISAAKQKPKP